jgi:hypothetical protein
VVDGETRTLTLVDQTLEEPAGQGGLSTLRLTALYEAPLAEGEPDRLRQASFADTNEPDRIGWREIVVVARSDGEIVTSDAPAEDVTDGLRTYPEDRLQSPLDRRRISFSFTPGSIPAEPPALDGSSGTWRRWTASRPDHPPRSGATGRGLAARPRPVVRSGARRGTGARQDTIIAAYLVSSRGRTRDAVLLGGVVSVMHTASVLVLGLVLIQVDRSITAESVYPVLTLVSGVAITGVGLWLLVARGRTLRPGSPRAHDHDHHHDGGHDHDDVTAADASTATAMHCRPGWRRCLVGA